jgi:teichuronic acid biosynthesis protein TuaE
MLTNLKYYFFYLTIITSFAGTLIISIPVGGIHFFPYRIFLILLWFLFLVKICITNGRIIISIIRIRAFLIFLFVWFFYAFFSTLWTLDKVNAIRNVLLLFMGISIILFINHYISDLKRLIEFYWLWLVIFFVLCLIGVWEVLTGNHLNISNLYMDDRLSFAPTAVFFNQNDFAWYLVLTIPFVLAWFRYYPKLISRVIAFFALILAIWLLIMTTSRSCFLAFFVGAIFQFFILFKLKNKIKVLFFLIFAFPIFYIIFSDKILFLYQIVQQQISSLIPLIVNSGEIGSLSVRKNLIKNALYFTVNSFGFGIGAGNVEYYMAHFSIYPVFDITNVHNWWIEIMVNYGVFVFVGYLCFYFGLLINIWFVYKKIQNLKEKMLCEVILTGLIVFIPAAISSSSAIALRFQWIFIGFALSFLNYYRKKNSLRL